MSTYSANSLSNSAATPMFINESVNAYNESSGRRIFILSFLQQFTQLFCTVLFLHSNECWRHCRRSSHKKRTNHQSPKHSRQWLLNRTTKQNPKKTSKNVRLQADLYPTVELLLSRLAFNLENQRGLAWRIQAFFSN